MNTNIFESIADFIIKKVQADSIESGFQLIVSYSEIEKKFGMGIEQHVRGEIIEALEDREEVADIQTDNDGYDVVLYTDYAPNYNDGITELSKEDAHKMLRNEELGKYEPIGLYYVQEGDVFVGIDNSNGDAWTEEFKKLIDCKRWLHGEEIPEAK
jgi:hypothetical protein